VYTPGDSYQIPEDLPAGQYRLWFLMTPRAGETDCAGFSGDLSAATGKIEIPDQASYTLDMDSG